MVRLASLPAALAYITYVAAQDPSLGIWGPTVNLPLVPVSAALNPVSGKLLTWSAFSPTSFAAEASGMTQTAEYDPASDSITSYTVANTNHDMFCEGLSLDFDGQLIATGGDTKSKTSLRRPEGGDWVVGAEMTMARGYQSSVTTSDGRMFTIGGSWAGDQGGKDGEIYCPLSNTWTPLPDCKVEPMLTNDAQGVYRADNHAWLFAWNDGSVLQAGPSVNMNWYDTNGHGGQIPAGVRGTDSDAMCGMAAMYDAVAGKILTAGGSPSYQNSPASHNAQVITIGAVNEPVITNEIAPMNFARAFHNSVVLPDGRVFIVGGQTTPIPFSDDTSILDTEVFDPATMTFTRWAAGPTPRNYHSVALLMPNGTIMSGGGGLCGDCETNHADMQLFTPPYLLNQDGTVAARPEIAAISTDTPQVGGTFSITLAEAPNSQPDFSLVRISSTTHTVNTDQRRVPLGGGATDDQLTYNFDLPAETGVLLPGFYYAFAIVEGVPSNAATVKVVV